MDLGRIQGGGFFYSTAASGTAVDKGTITPNNIQALIGDHIIFPNGDIRTITEKSGNNITCGEVIASLKGPQGGSGGRGPAGPPGPPGNDGNDGAPGSNGTNGKNGITPTIGNNGNWFLGSTDTGKPSRGPQGPQPSLNNTLTSTSTTVALTAKMGKQLNDTKCKYTKEIRNQDLNNIKTFNFIEKAINCTNAPATEGSLFVTQHNDKYITQIFISLGGQMYKRYYDGWTTPNWKEWTKILTSSVIYNYLKSGTDILNTGLYKNHHEDSLVYAVYNATNSPTSESTLASIFCHYYQPDWYTIEFIDCMSGRRWTNNYNATNKKWGGWHELVTTAFNGWCRDLKSGGIVDLGDATNLNTDYEARVFYTARVNPDTANRPPGVQYGQTFFIRNSGGERVEILYTTLGNGHWWRRVSSNFSGFGSWFEHA